MNQNPEQVSQLDEIFHDFTETEGFFDHTTPSRDFASIFPLGKLNDRYGGFILNEQIKIVVHVKVFSDIGEFSPPPVLEEETFGVYGFPVYP